MNYAFCNHCRATVPPNLPACPNCGASALRVPTQFAPAARDPDPSGCRSVINTGGGLLLLVMGIVAYFWTDGHNPQKCGFHCAQVACRIRGASDDAWCFGDETFTKIMIGAGLFALLGLLGVIQGFILQAKARG